MARERQAIQVAVVRAHVEPPARRGNRALDRAVRAEAPDGAARPCVERPYRAVPVADVEPVAEEERRRLGRADLLCPADPSEAGGEGDHLAVDPRRAGTAIARV